MMGYDSLIGSHYDHYYLKYEKFMKGKRFEAECQKGRYRKTGKSEATTKRPLFFFKFDPSQLILRIYMLGRINHGADGAVPQGPVP